MMLWCCGLVVLLAMKSPVMLPVCPVFYGSCAGTRSGNAMQFYSWQKYTPVGTPMVEPKWIQWDPDVTVAALAYADSLVLCRARPTFKAIASLSIQVCWEVSSLGYTLGNVKQVACHTGQLKCPWLRED